MFEHIFLVAPNPAASGAQDRFCTRGPGRASGGPRWVGDIGATLWFFRIHKSHHFWSKSTKTIWK